MKIHAYLFIAFSLVCSILNSSPRLLIKIPTRARPEQFFKTLDLYYQKLSGKVPYHFLISIDENDTLMNNQQIKNRLETYPHLTLNIEANTSKVDAYNAGIHELGDCWDIILVSSDDMEPIRSEFDIIIVNRMLEHFPNFDGVLNFFDGNVGPRCNTLPILGKTYYDRFGYIYNPKYESLFCDEELTVISKILKKEVICNDLIIKHNHPIYGDTPWDELYHYNESFYRADEKIFHTQREHCFYLPSEDVKASTSKKLSILICTLEERTEQFEQIYHNLLVQIQKAQLQDVVEALYFKDNREHEVGFKRNHLLHISNGEYVCFVDDDDTVHPDYVRMIYHALENEPDCVNLRGIITFDGTNPQEFVHSIHYNSYFEQEGVYYRPPNHLNPIKRSIAVQFPFPDKSFGEDYDWSMAIARSGLLKTESTIDTPYYFYQFIPQKGIKPLKKKQHSIFGNNGQWFGRLRCR